MSNIPTQEVVQLNSSWTLIGNEALVWKHGKKKHKYSLRKVSKEELLNIRCAGIPSFVLRFNGDLYYTEINNVNQINVTSQEAGSHKCATCKRCRPVADSNGGCAKVRDCSTEVYVREMHPFKKAVYMSKRLEKYDFIQYGIETFNIPLEVFDVIECENYQKYSTRIPMGKEELRRLQLSIDEFYCND